MPAEKQYPAVKLKNGDVDIDRNYNENYEDMEKKWEEFDTDLPGEDYGNLRTLEGVKACQEACAKDPDCKAYTYMKPGVRERSGHCWLKNNVSRAVKNSCCISGVKVDVLEKSGRLKTR